MKKVVTLACTERCSLTVVIVDGEAARCCSLCLDMKWQRTSVPVASRLVKFALARIFNSPSVVSFYPCCN